MSFTRPERLTKCSRMTSVPNDLYWGPPSYCLLMSGMFSPKFQDEGNARRPVPNWRDMKHMVVCLPASVEEQYAGHQECLASFGEPMNWVINHRSPLGYTVPRSSWCLVGQTILSRTRDRVPQVQPLPRFAQPSSVKPTWITMDLRWRREGDW